MKERTHVSRRIEQIELRDRYAFFPRQYLAGGEGVVMYLLFQCVAEAVAEKGLKGLAELVPGGGVAYDIAEGAWKKYKERCNEEKQLEEVKKLAQASMEEAKQAAVEAAKQAAADQPQIIAKLEVYLAQIPASIRQSLKRTDDPVGNTVPPNFVLRNADDMAKLLPAALPRFQAGDPLPGRPGWRLERQLGMGGFGEVWLARHPQFQSLVRAVKFCHNLQTRDRDMLHESKIIDRLLALGKHANIVRLLDVELEGNVPWLAYEYVEGGDLGDLIRTWGKLPARQRQDQAIASLQQLARAVGQFHSLQPPIVHRDLKPANILFDRKTRQLCITDFGISGIAARQMIDLEKRGVTTKACRLQSYLSGSFTPLYASLQQREGRHPDPRDDVHALGVIGYQMLTCQMDRGVGADVEEDLRELKIDEALIQLMRACTAQKPERRPKDAVALVEALAKLTSPADSFSDVQKDVREYLQAVDRERFLNTRAPARIDRWKASARKGFAPAQHLYGKCLDSGFGTEKNSVEAAAWFRKAVEQGYMPAQTDLGLKYVAGDGVEKDPIQGLALLRRVAEQGDARAQYSLGFLFVLGRGVPQDVEQGVAWHRRAADRGYLDAQFLMGQLYATGSAIAQDEAQAAAWFRKAAEQGHADSQATLGWRYANAVGVPKDEVQAVAWYLKAAEQGHAEAQYALGWMYANGLGMTKDEVQAATWYLKAAEQGNCNGQNALGLMYYRGRGVPKDNVQAAAWFRKAAEQGHAYAQCNLAEMYDWPFSTGVAKTKTQVEDEAKAATWYRKAAEQGNARGQIQLGGMYEAGRGVPKDDAQAAVWYRKAAEQGDGYAKEALQRLGQ